MPAGGSQRIANWQKHVLIAPNGGAIYGSATGCGGSDDGAWLLGVRPDTASTTGEYRWSRERGGSACDAPRRAEPARKMGAFEGRKARPAGSTKRPHLSTVARRRDWITTERHRLPAWRPSRHPQGPALHVHRRGAHLCLGEAAQRRFRRQVGARHHAARCAVRHQPRSCLSGCRARQLVSQRLQWTPGYRIIRTIYPPVDLFEDIADPADWELL